VDRKQMRFSVTQEQLQAAVNRWLAGDYSQAGCFDYDAAVLADAYCDLIGAAQEREGEGR
jgi:hypothetical protein